MKKIIDAIDDENGVTTFVKFKGNANFTSIEVAIKMAEENKIENVNVVTKKDGTKFLRTNPDGDSDNNLDTLCKHHK